MMLDNAAKNDKHIDHNVTILKTLRDNFIYQLFIVYTYLYSGVSVN